MKRYQLPPLMLVSVEENTVYSVVLSSTVSHRIQNVYVVCLCFLCVDPSLSLFHIQMCTPANTPATPPNFPDALTMFSRLKASESFNSGSGGSPMAASMATSPPPPQVGGWGVSPNVPNVPQPPQGLWTQGQPPTQPCPAWPMGVNPRAGTEQKASVAMEAER